MPSLSGTKQLGNNRISAGSIAGAGDYNLGANELTVGGNNDSTEVSGIISGTGSLVKTGNSTLTLSGANTYSGGTTVNDGGLLVNGSTGAVTVASGGLLGGNGTFASFANSGTLAPGTSIGTMTVTSNASFNAGSIYEVEIAGNGTSDSIAAGTATLNGGTVSITTLDPEGDYSDGQQYTILTTTGGVAGQFSAVAENSAFLDFALSYTPNDVVLNLSVVSDFSSVASSGNQRSVATALQSLGSSGDALVVQNALLGLSGDEARAAFESIGGEAHADAQVIGTNAPLFFSTALLGRAGSLTPTGAREGYSAILEGSETVYGQLAQLGFVTEDDAAASPGQSYAVWAGGFGNTTKIDGDGDSASWEADVGGFAVGLDSALPATWDLAGIFGLAAGWSFTDGEVPARNQSVDVETMHAGFYGHIGAAKNETGFAADGTLSYARQTYKTRRRISFSSIERTARASYGGDAISGSVEVRYGVDMDSVFPGRFNSTMISPLVRLGAGVAFTEGFSESGAGSLNLSASDDYFTSATAGVGFALNGDYEIGSYRIQPGVTLAYERLIGQQGSTSVLRLEGSPTSFESSGAQEGRNRLRLGAEAQITLTEDISLGFVGESTMSHDRSDFTASASVRHTF